MIQNEGEYLVFFDWFKFLCDQIGKTPTTVGKEIGISSSAVSMWKNGDRSPQTAQLQKIADYFGVTVDYLLTGEEKEKSVDLEADGEMNEMLEYIRRSPELRAMFSLSKNATPEELKQYINVIKAIRGENDE